MRGQIGIPSDIAIAPSTAYNRAWRKLRKLCKASGLGLEALLLDHADNPLVQAYQHAKQLRGADLSRQSQKQAKLAMKLLATPGYTWDAYGRQIPVRPEPVRVVLPPNHLVEELTRLKAKNSALRAEQSRLQARIKRLEVKSLQMPKAPAHTSAPGNFGLQEYRRARKAQRQYDAEHPPETMEEFQARLGPVLLARLEETRSMRERMSLREHDCYFTFFKGEIRVDITDFKPIVLTQTPFYHAGRVRNRLKELTGILEVLLPKLGKFGSKKIFDPLYGFLETYSKEVDSLMESSRVGTTHALLFRG
jgi:hypothetical protein